MSGTNNNCTGCCARFTTSKQLSGHLSKSPRCSNIGGDKVWGRAPEEPADDNPNEETDQGGVEFGSTWDHPSDDDPPEEENKSDNETVFQDQTKKDWVVVIADSDDEESSVDDEDGDDDEDNEISETEVKVEDLQLPAAGNVNPYKYEVPEEWGPGYMKSKLGKNEHGKQGLNTKNWEDMDAETKSDVELLKVLKGHPLKLFKEIREWRHNSEFIYNHKLDPTSYKTKTREAVIDHLAERYGLHQIRPKVMQIRLPNLGVDTELVVFVPLW